MDEDLGIKIGTEEQGFWEKLLKKCREEIENNKREIIINKAVIRLAKRKINYEKEKLK